MMRGYAQSNACRSQTCWPYFGEDLTHRCGHCDNCAEGVAEETDEGTGDEPFAVHSTVRHAEWVPAW
ncbi:RecQ family zinc-binding domain-containing protein [Actinoplanes nipponensis]|uniref:RecQ family zinc-binding domain-containing protein n=1 Tax=Actinoplanes nipponensis TaxID=135950 RepID=UPI0031E5FAE6